jgi:hypothetical protein
MCVPYIGRDKEGDKMSTQTQYEIARLAQMSKEQTELIKTLQSVFPLGSYTFLDWISEANLKGLITHEEWESLNFTFIGR